MGNVKSMRCSGPFPLKGVHTGVIVPSQVETEQSLIIIVIVVVEYYCFITIIIDGAGQSRSLVFSYVLHYVSACCIINSPFYIIKVLPANRGCLLLSLF